MIVKLLKKKPLFFTKLKNIFGFWDDAKNPEPKKDRESDTPSHYLQFVQLPKLLGSLVMELLPKTRFFTKFNK